MKLDSIITTLIINAIPVLLIPLFFTSFETLATQQMPQSESSLQIAEDKKVHVRAGHARALREIDQMKYQKNDFRSITIEVKELTDNKGLKYLAGIVSRAEVEQYLTQMQQLLDDEFEEYRQAQVIRDHGLFHLTIVNPYEYQAMTDKTSMVGEKLPVQLLGLGKVSKGNHTAYFVVASSTQGQFLRQKQILAKKDFHITLGFDAQDVFGVSKGKDTLINQPDSPLE